MVINIYANVEVAHTDELPLTKSLGYVMRGNLQKTLQDARLNQELTDLYQEMIRVSEESHKPSEIEDNRLRRVIEDEQLDSLKDAMTRRRRSRSSLGTVALQRRVRSQATRRDKLNSQSLRSHVEHTRLSVSDQSESIGE
ncbi:uncharacterized protein LOC113513214 isoform X2 [Galleria mellonella]|uniref:Uncharacterized protein LOC113513214 isoform X2 n=1 Tax=Galleria mellonella TaxID=7137 RepID=A0ABM3ML60_GALME|nr:uncharacterized protein LOC113513214 isoform X2 [Galleria mellonella]